MLGDARARLLRGVGRPSTMSALAQLLSCAPNTVAYHCTRLARAGLIERNRLGQEVWISRTERGDALVELTSGP